VSGFWNFIKSRLRPAGKSFEIRPGTLRDAPNFEVQQGVADIRAALERSMGIPKAMALDIDAKQRRFTAPYGVQPNPATPGCGKQTRVVGTNGGTMPCGGLYRVGDSVAPYYCDECAAKLRPKPEEAPDAAT
jgi:hypothetical protein